MRAMATGIAIAQTYKCPAIIYWNNCEGLKADFSSLFIPIKIDNVKLEENQKWIFSISNSKDYLKRWLFLKMMFKQVIFNFSIYKNPNKSIFQTIGQATHSLLLISCYPMCEDYDMNSVFIPQPDIQKRIDEITSDFTSHTIGIHIRRTDNKQSIQNSPIEAFILSMKKEIEKNKDTKFYIASDDENVKQQLISHFKDRIITCHDDTSRNNLNGMKFAVVDLYCLSKTHKIIGSVYSSYSQIASEIGNIPIEYAQKQ